MDFTIPDYFYVDESFYKGVYEPRFESVTFTRFDEKRFVDASCKDLDEDTLKLTLVLTYYMKTEFSDVDTHRYISLAEDED